MWTWYCEFTVFLSLYNVKYIFTSTIVYISHDLDSDYYLIINIWNVYIKSRGFHLTEYNQSDLSLCWKECLGLHQSAALCQREVPTGKNTVIRLCSLLTTLRNDAVPVQACVPASRFSTLITTARMLINGALSKYALKDGRQTRSPDRFSSDVQGRRQNLWAEWKKSFVMQWRTSSNRDLQRVVSMSWRHSSVWLMGCRTHMHQADSAATSHWILFFITDGFPFLCRCHCLSPLEHRRQLLLWIPLLRR